MHVGNVYMYPNNARRWILLHLVAHPEGLPQDSLSTFARASMAATLRLHGGGSSVAGGTVEAGGPGSPGRLVVLAQGGGSGGGGASLVLLDAESLALVPTVATVPPLLKGTGRGAGRGARGLAAATAAATSTTGSEVDNSEDVGGSGNAHGGVRPVPGVVWANDAEVEGLLGTLAPFLRQVLSAQPGDDGCDGDCRRVALAHSSLAAAALSRYDRLDPVARPAVQPPPSAEEEEGEESLPYRRYADRRVGGDMCPRMRILCSYFIKIGGHDGKVLRQRGLAGQGM
jgi:hypothetical protein